jgi:hypothetical protein
MVTNEKAGDWGLVRLDEAFTVHPQLCVPAAAKCVLPFPGYRQQRRRL